MSVNASQILLALAILTFIVVVVGIGLAIWWFWDGIKATACDKIEGPFAKIALGCPDPLSDLPFVKPGGIGEGGFGIGEDPCTTYQKDTGQLFDEAGDPVLNTNGDSVFEHPKGSPTGAFSVNGREGCWTCEDGFEQNRKMSSLPDGKGFSRSCKKGIFTTATKVNDFELLDKDNLICPTLDRAEADAAGVETNTFKGIGEKDCVVCPKGTTLNRLATAGSPYKCEVNKAKDLGRAGLFGGSCETQHGHGAFRGITNCFRCDRDPATGLLGSRKPLTTECAVPAVPVPEDLITGGCAASNPNIGSDRLFKIGIKGCAACPAGFVPTPSPPRILGTTPLGLIGVAIRRGPIACVKKEDRDSVKLSTLTEQCFDEDGPNRQGVDGGPIGLIECIDNLKVKAPTEFQQI